MDKSAPTDVRVSEILAGLSYALDLTEGQRPGHAVRGCAIGLRIADALALDQEERTALFYALLMKDLGCSSNAARFAVLFGADDHDVKSALKTVDWPRALQAFTYVARNVAPGRSWLRRVWQTVAVLAKGPEGAREIVRTRCERGAEIARQLNFPEPAVAAIRAVDEHWNGHGQPYALKGTEIPLLGRILSLAQTFEVFATTYGLNAAYAMALDRRGRWFDPAIVDALDGVRDDAAFWNELLNGDELRLIDAMAPVDAVRAVNDEYLDVAAEAFAKVIDAKSPWTYRHSTGVADIAAAIARTIGYGPGAVRDLRRAALLHDIGKLGVSNLILDKVGRLSDAELTAVRRHPSYTQEILNRVGCFRHFADIAASHHERLDGTGYHRGLTRAVLDNKARVLCAADICDALLATRPYRPGLPPERVINIMRREVGGAIDPECFDALSSVLIGENGEPRHAAPAVEFVRALAEDYTQAA